MNTIELRKAAHQVLTGTLLFCLNCAYFTQYYLLAAEGYDSFVPCNLGYCAHTTVSFKPAHSSCKCFQEKEVSQ